MKFTLAIHAVAAIALIYVVSYLSLLTPEQWSFCALGSPGIPWTRTPQYRIKSEYVESVFVPLVELDKRIRPNYWSNLAELERQSVSSANSGFGGSYGPGAAGFGGGVGVQGLGGGMPAVSTDLDPKPADEVSH
jgi:hypothetical protein